MNNIPRRHKLAGFFDFSAPFLSKATDYRTLIYQHVDPMAVKLANPSPLGFAGFATTLMTLSLSMMGARGVENEGMFIGNLLLLAGLGLIITAQWEMVRGNTFGYTILSAFGFYYAGYGMRILKFFLEECSRWLIRPSMVLLEFHLLPRILIDTNNALQYGNVANIIVYGALELLYILSSAAKFAMADGDFPTGRILTRTAGAFGAISALSGFYLLYQGLCEQLSPVPAPLGELHCFEPRIITKEHTPEPAQ
ncbi:hypothetical protein INS49_003118 [Diaporthe citri]|uniref:uncharacterized protein n=1 Tax=Diaporthe citri TaxID=83186 RepID=UPI001C7FF3AE|nr:uncharacterized protein INS49_003118 [Diaporthe citri]KAG6368900.1 hypothetical protein INS49_003118 [Diaporthe citri]